MTRRMMKCNTYENRKLVDGFIQMFNPYEVAPSIGINLVELSRYAKKHNKKISELMEEEMIMLKK